MNSTLRQFRDFFTSLQLTVGLLFASLVLVFLATLHQVNLGIWAVLEKYFRSFVVVIVIGDEVSLRGYSIAFALVGIALAAIRLIFRYEDGVRRILNSYVFTTYLVVIGLPAVFCAIIDRPFPAPVLPGGYFIGGLLLINLVAAHVYRFQFTWKKAGIQLAHAGLILLLIGELLTGLLQEESFMRMDTGETKRYSESFHENELVFINHGENDVTEVVAIPEALVADKKSIQHPRLPFQVNVREYFPNSNLQMRAQAPQGAGAVTATAGFGTQLALLPMRMTYKPNERNVPGAIVEIVGPDANLGLWLASPLLSQAQTFTHAGKTWEIAFRSKRIYQPFTLTLLKFSHDRYPGTNIPKNFSSRVRVKSDDGTEDREVLIFMNNPLRFGGLTFYQAGFDNNDTTTILQVVRNPGWLLPYIACILMGVGLCLQFGISLANFIRKRSAVRSAPAAPAAKRAEAIEV